MYVGKKSQFSNKWLYLIQFVYNQQEHGYIEMNPFNVLYGQECRAPISF